MERSPFLPRFVVTKMTPLAARDPYMEVAAASFNTSIDSIDSGSISAKAFVPVKEEVMFVMGTPSITHKGELKSRCSALKVLYPRRMVAVPPLPGAPLMLETSNPATRPCNKLERFEVGTLIRSSPLIEVIAPVISRFVVFPYAITLTSSKSDTSSSKTTFTTPGLLTGTSFIFIPTNEYINTKFFWGARTNLYSPFESVAIPFVVPFMYTDTPGKGPFFLSVTRPRITHSSIGFTVSPTTRSLVEIRIVSCSMEYTNELPFNTKSNTFTTSISFTLKDKFFTCLTSFSL